MTLSPLIILILLLFLASIALIFLLWSLLTLKTPHLVINSRSTQRQAKEAVSLSQDHAQTNSPKRTASGPRPSVYSSVVYPERQRQKKAPASKDELKQRLSNNQVRGLNAQIPVPNPPPVEAVVTRTHSLLDRQEALEPLEPRPSKFQVISSPETPSKTKSQSEQVPLFENLPEPPFQLLNNEEEKEEEDVFERFIRSKNDDLDF